MNKFRFVPLAVVLACLSAACSSNQPTTPGNQPVGSHSQATESARVTPVATEASVATKANAAPTAVPATPTIQSSMPAAGRDFNQIEVCSLISDEEVAQLDNGSVQSPAQSSDYGTTRGCSYGIQTADGGYDNVIIYVEPADLLEASLELSADQGMPVVGVADQAFLQNDVDAGQFRLLVERQGDFGIEVIGENGDSLVAIARLLLTRIH